MSNHDKMKCIFCFKKLSHADICFETVNDHVDATPDEIKLNFLRLTGPYMDEYDWQAMTCKPIVPYKEGDPAFELDPETGIPVAWNEPLEGRFPLKSKRRLCAFCHMPLPSEFGKRPNVMIGFCGNTGAGKTVYMLSLIRDLSNKIDSMFVSPDPVFYSGLKTDYRDMYSAMYADPTSYRLPPATDPYDPMSPLVLNCSCGGTDFMLTLYDMAGEGVPYAPYMSKQARILENSDGVIYLKDPDYFPGMPKAHFALEEHQYTPDLFSMITRYARIAITMTKIDKLLDMYGENEEFRSIVGPMFNNDRSVHANGFDSRAAQANNGRMYNLYKWDNTRDQSILSLYDRQRKSESHDAAPQKKRGILEIIFGPRKPAVQKTDPADQRVMLFGASALGRNATVYKEENDYFTSYYLSQEPSGLHNVDPLLWLLYMAGVFPAKKTKD